MRVFMTGATGFLGLNIVDALLAAGHEVVCYARATSKRTHLDGFPVRVETGDIRDHAALARAMQGCSAVIHAAGDTRCHWRDIDALRAVNVDGTRAVAESASRVGIRRLVFTSTTSTIGSNGGRLRDGAPSNESTPLRGFRADSPYAQTKREAEAILRSFRRMDCVLLNPAEVIGPYDHTLQWGRIVLAVATGNLPFVPPGAATFSPARDVADAHVAALTRGEHGERYILGGSNVLLSDFIEMAGVVTGMLPTPRDRRPYGIQQLHARLAEWLGREPAVDAYRMKVFAGHHLFDDGKARAELGYRTRPLRTALTECFDWYRDNGFLGGAATNPGSRSAAPPGDPHPHRAGNGVSSYSGLGRGNPNT